MMKSVNAKTPVQNPSNPPVIRWDVVKYGSPLHARANKQHMAKVLAIPSIKKNGIKI